MSCTKIKCETDAFKRPTFPSIFQLRTRNSNFSVQPKKKKPLQLRGISNRGVWG